MPDTHITNERLARVISRALRPHIGPRARHSYVEAAAALGVEARTVVSWVAGQTPPQSHKMIRLFRWLGPAFTNDILGLAGLHTLHVEPAGCDEFGLNMQAAELCFEMAAAFADDGKVDHMERLRLMAVAKRLQPILGAYITQHAADVHPMAAE